MIDTAIRSPITSYAIASETGLADWNGKYAFNTKGKHPWLQRACFWLLDKLGAQWQDTTLSYKRVEIDSRDVVELVQRQIVNIDYIVGARKPLRIVLGLEQMREVTRQSWDLAPHQFRFDIQAQVGVSDGGKVRQTLLGIPVIVVPWIDGCFVMYEEDFK